MSRTPPASNCSASFSVETVQGPLAVGMSNRAISMLFAVFRCGRDPTPSARKLCLSLNILRSMRGLSSSKHGVANASIPSVDLLMVTLETKMNRRCPAPQCHNATYDPSRAESLQTDLVQHNSFAHAAGRNALDIRAGGGIFDFRQPAVETALGRSYRGWGPACRWLTEELIMKQYLLSVCYPAGGSQPPP